MKSFLFVLIFAFIEATRASNTTRGIYLPNFVNTPGSISPRIRINTTPYTLSDYGRTDIATTPSHGSVITYFPKIDIVPTVVEESSSSSNDTIVPVQSNGHLLYHLMNRLQHKEITKIPLLDSQPNKNSPVQIGSFTFSVFDNEQLPSPPPKASLCVKRSCLYSSLQTGQALYNLDDLGLVPELLKRIEELENLASLTQQLLRDLGYMEVAESARRQMYEFPPINVTYEKLQDKL